MLKSFISSFLLLMMNVGLSSGQLPPRLVAPGALLVPGKKKSWNRERSKTA